MKHNTVCLSTQLFIPRLCITNHWRLVMESEDTFIRNLVKNVEEQRCLYDKNDEFYYNKIVRDRVWKEIAEKCCRSVDDCKNRWKLLRERYVKEMKKKDAKLDEGTPYVDSWKYRESLMFLIETITRRRARDSAEEVNVDSALDHSVMCGDSLLDPLATAHTKTTIASFDNINQRLGETIEILETSSPSGRELNALDNAFLNTVKCLMRELPELVKEEFQSRMLQELYKLRRQCRDLERRNKC